MVTVGLQLLVVYTVILLVIGCVCVFVAREPLPTMFSMLHPLDEITPLVCKSGSKCTFILLYVSSVLTLRALIEGGS